MIIIKTGLIITLIKGSNELKKLIGRKIDRLNKQVRFEKN